MRKSRFSLGIGLSLLALFFASCSGKRSLESIELPPTPVISETDRYGLILDPYISLRDQPGETGVTVAHARRGDIMAVLGKKLVSESGESEVWVNLESGWVNEQSIQLFSGKDKAENAASSLITK
jgi:hypothetical protein